MEQQEARAKRHYAAPALERGFDILEMFAGSTGELTISEIAQRLGKSISEVFRIIIVMERRGWLFKDPQTDRYGVAYRMLDVALRATPAHVLTNVAAPVMQDLAASTFQSCHLVIRNERHGLVIHRQENAGPAGFAMRSGAVIDLVTSCSGHVLLGFEPDEKRAALLDALDAAHLGERLATVRSRGYEMQPSARTAGVTDISAPIFAFDGKVAAALTLPYLQLIDGSQSADIDQAREALIAAARTVSVRLGAAAALS